MLDTWIIMHGLMYKPHQVPEYGSKQFLPTPEVLYPGMTSSYIHDRPESYLSVWVRYLVANPEQGLGIQGSVALVADMRNIRLIICHRSRPLWTLYGYSSTRRRQFGTAAWRRTQGDFRASTNTAASAGSWMAYWSTDSSRCRGLSL